MTAIGDSLRREREKRNLDLTRIAQELKISQRFLEAIENDEFSKLPGGVFTKSFVRQYASYLELDAEDIVAQVAREIEPKVELPPEGEVKPDVPGIEVEMLEDGWQSVRERRAPLPSWVRAGALLVVLMVACSGVYYWMEQRPHRPTVAHVSPPPQKQAPPPAPVTPAPAPTPAPPVETAPPVVQASAETATASRSTSTPAAAPAPDGSAASATASTTTPATPAKPVSDIPVLPANPNASVRIAITAEEPVWVRADVNGKYQFSGTLQPQDTRTIDADGEVVLRLGNAGGATITLNGKPVGAVGPKGQIRTVQFTSGGFQIVSAPPKADPFDRL